MDDEEKLTPMAEDSVEGVPDKFKTIEKHAEILTQAAKVIDILIDLDDDMIDEKEPYKEEKDMDLNERLETAQTVCQMASMSMVLKLAERGYVPEIDGLQDDEDDSDDESDVSPTFY